MATFSHKDGVLTITPQIGAPTSRILQPLRLLSCERASFDPGGKASYGKQFAQTPYAILIGSAEPKLEYELSDAQEAWDAAEWVGGIGAQPFTVSHVFTRLLIPTVSFLFLGCCLENGGGFGSDDAGGVKDKLIIKLTDCWKNGKTIYAA